ncbi:MAG: hypothetical protein C7B46_20605 [Sulfobacillus benefaciens]|uniref:Uncharacterized protein n=1 Tax=Sulfobacillus benefaciens TaxID=453960 RepID=A0A2T2WTD4_9FIRM|nr:MAG: hypothetical protein C7B46_20605 [Sulfobacillus benefaciens]
MQKFAGWSTRVLKRLAQEPTEPIRFVPWRVLLILIVAIVGLGWMTWPGNLQTFGGFWAGWLTAGLCWPLITLGVLGYRRMARNGNPTARTAATDWAKTGVVVLWATLSGSSLWLHRLVMAQSMGGREPTLAWVGGVLMAWAIQGVIGVLIHAAVVLGRVGPVWLSRRVLRGAGGSPRSR